MAAAPTTPNVSQNRSAIKGFVKVAPLGTAVPADVTTAWAAGWIDLGLIDDKGVTSSNKKTMNKVKAWQTPLPIRQLLAERDLIYKFAMLQLNWKTRALWMDAGATSLSGGTYTLVAPADANVTEWMLGIEWQDGTLVYREFTQRGVFTDSGDVVYVDGTPVLQELTYETLPLDLTTGPVATLTNDPAFASS
ncbi:MAG: hypothetical protein ACRDVE_15690 [Actinocrinis sp.]